MTATAPVARSAILSAVRALARAARFDEARALLPDLPGYAVARAELVHAEAYLAGKVPPQEVVDAARAEAATPEDRWDADFLGLRRRYAMQLFDAATELGSPEGRDLDEVRALRELAEQLHAAAPDRGRAGFAAFYSAVILTNLLGEQRAGREWLEEALSAGQEGRDDYVCFEALRHLGDHALEVERDQETARQQWELSASYAARAGGVPQVLAQQVLLAELAARRGDGSAAGLLAGEVARWAEVIGAARTAAHAHTLARGASVTAMPGPDGSR